MASKTHFRLCHVCNNLNSADGDLVTTCECCGKHLAPFYFFDESRAMGMAESTFYSTHVVESTASALPHKEYPPVWGLTAYWEP